MTLSVHVLDCGVVGVLVGHKEGSLDVTPVGICPSTEDFIIEVNVVVVDGIIKGDGDHLGHSVTVVIVRTEVTGNFRAVLRAEAVRKLADILVTRGCTVGVVVNI